MPRRALVLVALAARALGEAVRDDLGTREVRRGPAYERWRQALARQPGTPAPPRAFRPRANAPRARPSAGHHPGARPSVPPPSAPLCRGPTCPPPSAPRGCNATETAYNETDITLVTQTSVDRLWRVDHLCK
eukprot:CAMPEP_0119263856 /NCGR_PEP_ID=MMETSP1329-20130426/3141_1 /TAXON_ID=114041 /ORGANISM="Genus nov. species nov., Strain RCC1024" /LENGTH=131 /DNA_ID=CAMNT_0007263593 /DNA_START=189 /DNA_END=581 /DNA_ORIENTATION=+